MREPDPRVYEFFVKCMREATVADRRGLRIITCGVYLKANEEKEETKTDIGN